MIDSRDPHHHRRGDLRGTSDTTLLRGPRDRTAQVLTLLALGLFGLLGLLALLQGR